MTERRMTDIPLLVTDMVETPPIKPSGKRLVSDLDEITTIKDSDVLLIQRGSKTFRADRSALMSPLTDDGLWDDYVGSLSSGAKGVSAPPDFNEFITGQRANSFAVGDEMWISIHVKHDWKVGTDIYPHMHWLTNDATPAGNAVWQIGWTIAKRNDTTPAVFPTSTSITLSASMTVQNAHVVTEADDTASPSQVIPAAEVEVDCLVMLHVKRLTDGGAGGDAKTLFGLQLDLHYQKDRIGTVSKAPPFYS